MRGIGDRKTSVDALKIAPVASGSRTRLATGFSAFLSGICAISSAQTKTIFLKEKAGARRRVAAMILSRGPQAGPVTSTCRRQVDGINGKT